MEDYQRLPEDCDITGTIRLLWFAISIAINCRSRAGWAEFAVNCKPREILSRVRLSGQKIRPKPTVITLNAHRRDWTLSIWNIAIFLNASLATAAHLPQICGCLKYVWRMTSDLPVARGSLPAPLPQLLKANPAPDDADGEAVPSSAFP